MSLARTSLVLSSLLLAFATDALAQDGDAVPRVPSSYYEQSDPLGFWLPFVGVVLVILAIWLPMRRTQRMDRHAEAVIEETERGER